MLSKGEVVGLRYRVLDVLGRGGMGTVYLAEHVALKRRVALKILDAAYAGSDMERRFEREARTAARLDHPGCVRVLDHGRTVDQLLYLAMEHLEGPTLASWLAAAGALALPDVGRAAAELLASLAYAHGESILHRDVKPENVMFARRGGHTRVVLIDFGLAQLRDDAGITHQGTCVGSPSYVAPERLLGRAYDQRSDLYSVGIVLYEMITGKRPFGDGAALDIAMRQIQDPAPPVEALRPDAPPALCALVARALAKDPAARFATAAEMAAALEAACGAERPHARLTAAVRAVAPPAPPARAATPPPVPIVTIAPRPPAVTRSMATPPRPPAPAPAPAPARPTSVDPRAATIPAITRPAAMSLTEEAPTLSWRMSNGPLLRRVVAWLLHGAWRGPKLA